MRTAQLILAGFIFVLGNFNLGSGFVVYVDYDYSGSLQPGAPVKVAGNVLVGDRREKPLLPVSSRMRS